MRAEDILSRRLYCQRLEGHRFTDPREAVRLFGAVQSQDFGGAQWGVCQRLEQTAAAEFSDAFARGDILRTHVMRPTWHLVAAEDIRWMVDLTRPRLLRLMAYYFRQFDLDEPELARTNVLIHEVLQGGNQLTRSELAARLDQQGIAVQNGVRLSYILIHAEISGLICSGAPTGKQQTYALLNDRAPAAPTMDRENAVAELARRYFRSHGPATVEDFAWWSGLTKSEAYAGLEAVRDTFDHDNIDDRYYWYAADALAAPAFSEAHLLPNYDEYVVAYTDRGNLFSSGQTADLDSRGNPLFNNVLILGGTIAGTWKKTVRRASLQLEITPFRRLTSRERSAIHPAAEQYAEHLRLAELSVVGI